MGIEKHYFISYSHADMDIARKLKEDLEKNGLETWMDEYNLFPGREWRDAIQKNIRQSLAVLYLASPTSLSSSYVAHELALAEIYNKTIIPLWVQGDAEWVEVVHPGLFTTQHIDLRPEFYKDRINKLVQTLKNPSESDTGFMGYPQQDDNGRSLPEVENPSPTSHFVIILLRSLLMLVNIAEVVVISPLLNQLEKLLGFKLPNKKGEIPMDIDQLQRNPYKGLHAFEYEDRGSFFGREKLIHKMTAEVRNILHDGRRDSNVPRCMMVVGASGSGKSSLVMAGLLPALEEKKNIPEVKDWFFLAPVRPGEYPMDALVQALKLPFLNKTKANDSPLKRWNQPGLRRTLDDPDSHGLSEILWKVTHNPDDRIVLIVDQFEEIFAPAANPDQQKQRKQFIDLLIATAIDPDIPMLLLFTLRADFFHRMLDNEALYNQIEQHLIHIPPMTSEELRTVIEKPAQRSKVTFDPYLAEDLLYEVYERPESLPLLQFTLEQLFEHRDRGEQRMTRQSYDEMEGLKGAINKHAETTYDKLPTPEHQAEARKLFTEHFIYISEADNAPSHLESGEEITRRRVTEADLHLNDLSVRREVVETFVKARLLTPTRLVRQSTDLGNIPDITYEISHETLINAWERLGEWITEDRKDIYLIQSLRSRIRQWDQESGQRKKKDFLVEKLVLQQLQEYRQRKTLGPSAEKFLQASLAQQRRQNIQKYVLFVSAVVFLILALVLEPIISNMIFPNLTIVTSLADSGPGTLNDAIQKAADGATITFNASLARQTIHLVHNGLNINKSITIRGPSGDISITSGSTGNYIQIEPGKNVTIEDMTFTNSSTLKHSMIENAGNLTINDSTINGNKSYSSYGGGAIDNNGGTLILNNDTLEKNKVSTNGGAIYNLFGTVNINNSTIKDNEAYGNGGGIYSQGGVVTVGGSCISDNNADSNAGGGIDMVNGSLSMHDTQVESNTATGGSSNGIGGGIAIVGSVAFIDSSVITANTANAGGGIAVTDDTDNNSSSLVKLRDIIATSNSNAIHYIGQNTGGDIAGRVTPVDTNFQILDDPSIDNLGNPPPPSPPQKLPNYLGVANINTFCLNKDDSYGKRFNYVDPNATDILFTCFNHANRAVANFSGQAICQSQYPPDPEGSVIDRMANYDDPTSLQCYKNLRLLGPIGQAGFAKYCSNQPQYTGLFDNSQYRETTAYDWLCQPKDASKLPSGLSVTAACNLQYGISDAIDILDNYNNKNGWECWEPA